MAQKRMFDKTITNSDDFLELPDSSQVLYFHLSMNADDDGFVNNWKSIMKMTGTKEDDLKLLILKQYIIPFDSGVIVIKHWRINNYLRQDRYKETTFKEEKSQLSIGNNEEYILKNTLGIPVVYPDKNSIDKNSIEEKEYKEKERYGEFKNVLLTEEEYHKLEESNLLPYIEKLSSYIASKGKKYKSHYATILTWSRGDNKQPDYKKHSVEPEWLDKEIEGDEVSDEIKELARRIREED